jgi:hypothetical protein
MQLAPGTPKQSEVRQELIGQLSFCFPVSGQISGGGGGNTGRAELAAGKAGVAELLADKLCCVVDAGKLDEVYVEAGNEEIGHEETEVAIGQEGNEGIGQEGKEKLQGDKGAPKDSKDWTTLGQQTEVPSAAISQ